MSSVDLGFKSLISKYNIPGKFTYYQLYSPPTGTNTIGKPGIAYAILPQDFRFYESQDLIIFWGDFLHMYQYQEAVAKILFLKKQYTTKKSAKNRVKEVFLLKGQSKKVLAKTYSFGSTILFNTISNETEVEYRDALANFLSGVAGVWFRDVFSALKANHIRGVYHDSCLGVDCATLIDPEFLNITNQKQNYPPHLGLFIGRTVNYITEIVGFAKEIETQISGHMSWIKWGDSRAFPTLKAVRKVIAKESMEGFTDLGEADTALALSRLATYDLIITDTYHICVNAWNLGIPAICVYGNDTYNERNVNAGNLLAKRDKRQVFMSMYDALDFLIPYTELAIQDLKQRRISLLIDRFKTGVEIKAIRQRLRQHAVQSGQAFIDSISKHLG